ncbi:capsule assembly Wzi family protein [Pedobacter sp. JY14-1]|uniref:capsule assembly Wzi family protein n=1 Tax=Pedobacter sp. JY14-1 TaxID=3034151 RepID=UPI0023E33D40|nr:capsule assembly Wzi family protein [Pedobacter sp. JY14-1]
MKIYFNSKNGLKKLLIFVISAAFLFVDARGQLASGYNAEIEVQAIGTTNSTVPFWMRSNQFGSIPLSGISGTAIGRISKDYELANGDKNEGNPRLMDWAFAIEGRANGGNNANLQLIEAYLKAKLSIFQIKAGRSRDIMGLNGDTTLSSGNFAVSGNALGVPKIELSIPEYWKLPILNELISIKGTFSHGWIGHRQVADTLGRLENSEIIISIKKRPYTYFHQKSLYGRIGREDWKLKLYGGFSHQVFWGSEKEIYGPDRFGLNGFETFWYVVSGSAYGGKNSSIERSKIGNQLGSIDVGLEYDFGTITAKLYRQNFYDVGALSKLANIADGLNGFTLRNNKIETSPNAGFQWKKILVEFFYSKNQAGYPWSKPTASGDEDYYNNYYYLQGWSYMDLALGNPFITLQEDAKAGQATAKETHFINNRVSAIHLGFSSAYKGWVLTSKLSFSRNYGTFRTSRYGHSTGPDRFPNRGEIFRPVNQTSFYLDGLKRLNKNNIYCGFTVAIDRGDLLNNSSALSIRLNKKF